MPDTLLSEVSLTNDTVPGYRFVTLTTSGISFSSKVWIILAVCSRVKIGSFIKGFGARDCFLPVSFRTFFPQGNPRPSTAAVCPPAHLTQLLPSGGTGSE